MIAVWERRRIGRAEVELYARGLSTRDIKDTFTDEVGRRLLSRAARDYPGAGVGGETLRRAVAVPANFERMLSGTFRGKIARLAGWAAQEAAGRAFRLRETETLVRWARRLTSRSRSRTSARRCLASFGGRPDLTRRASLGRPFPRIATAPSGARIGRFTSSGAIDANGACGANGAHTNTRHQRAWQLWSTRD